MTLNAKELSKLFFEVDPAKLVDQLCSDSFDPRLKKAFFDALPVPEGCSAEEVFPRLVQCLYAALEMKENAGEK